MTPRCVVSLERLQWCEDTSQVGLSLATLLKIPSARLALTQGDVMSSSTSLISLRSLHQREMPLCPQWAQQRVSSRYTITAASLCLMILSGLSAGCSADGDLAADSRGVELGGYYGEYAGESGDHTSRDSDSLPDPAMGNDLGYLAGNENVLPDEGSAAGEVGASPEEPCANSAYQADQEAEMDLSEGESFVVCLDGLISATDRAEGQLSSSGDDMPSVDACDIAGELSRILSQTSGEQVTCVDRDADCYYECPGWELPEELQDIDDRRAFVNRRGEATPDVDLAQTCRDQGTAGDETLCCQLNAVDMTLDDDVSPLICRTPLSMSEGEVVKLIQPCQGGGVVWISELDGQQAIKVLRLAELTAPPSEVVRVFSPRVLSYPAVSQGVALGAITEVACRDEQMFSALLVDSEGEIFYVGFNSVGMLEIAPLYGDQGPLDVPSRAESLSVNEQGLFRWEITSPESPLRFEDHAFGFLRPRGLTQLPEGVVQRALRCNQCEAQGENQLSSVSLTTRGEIIISDHTMGSLETVSEGTERLSSPTGIFSQLIATARIIGLTSVDETRVATPTTHLSFSIWADPELRTQLLHFDSTRWGFSEVTLSAIVGDTALLQLKSDQNMGDRTQWGLYNIPVNRLKVIDTAEILSSYMGIDLTQIKSPRLVGEKMIWVRSQEGGLNTELITLQLTR